MTALDQDDLFSREEDDDTTPSSFNIEILGAGNGDYEGMQISQFTSQSLEFGETVSSGIVGGSGETSGSEVSGSEAESSDGGTTTTVTASGDAFIDGILTTTRWGDATIQYSFPTSNAVYDYTTLTYLPNNFLALTAQQQRAAEFALDADRGTNTIASSGFSVEGFTNLGILYDASPDTTPSLKEEIRLANTTSATLGTARVADFPGNTETTQTDDNGDIWFGPYNNNTYHTPTAGNYAWATHIHEIGHALGLSHGHSTWQMGVALPTAFDSMEYSVMTYRSYVGHNASGYTNETWGYAQTWMMADIAALQYMYGADYSTNSGNTVYKWNPGSGDTLVNGTVAIDAGGNVIFATIWDGGGTDTYDLSSYSSNLDIDLRPGEHSVFDQTQLAELDRNNIGGQTARGSIFNARLFNNDSRSLIENAIGGTGNDSIVGNDARNDLDGGNGNDTIRGYDGNDTIRGGAGNDWLYGNNQNDQLIGGAGTDNMYGGAGNDSFELDVAGTHSDLFDGGSGNDTVDLNATGTFDLSNANFDEIEEIRFTAFDTSLILSNKELDDSHELGNGTIIDGYAVSGADETLTINFGTSYGQDKNFASWVFQDWGGQNDQIFINGSSSANNITGTTQDDTIDGKGGNDTLNGFSGNDSLLGDAGNDSILGGDGNDTLIGGSGTDTLRGGNDNDRITSDGDGGLYYGDAGNDTLFSGLGFETMDGGVGIDRIDHTAYNGSYVFNMVTGLTNFGGESFANFEIAVMGGGNDSVTGNASNNTIYGGNGNDTLLGGGGVDTLYGQGGNDLLSIDTGGPGHVLDGGTGDDTASWDYSGLSWTLSLLSNTGMLGATNYATLVSIENLIGGSGNDTITGNNSNNVLRGGLGNDSIDGSGGVDKLYGEGGNDILSIGFGGTGHLADGGAGNDTVDFSYSSFDSWTISLVSNTAMIGATNYADLVSIENATGGGGNDSITGNTGANELSGGAGADLLNGGAGNDTLNGDAGNDTLNGEAGNDSLLGGADNDLLDGGSDNDTLSGGDGNDTLLGGLGTDSLLGDAGTDSLDGGDANDTLSGGDGNDTLLGGLGSDSLLGDANNDSLDGGDGNDTLRGGDGIDTLRGGIGNDSLDGGSGTNYLYGGAGNDTAVGGDGTDFFYFTAADVGSFEGVYGGAGTDYMILSGAGVFDFRGLDTTNLETIRFNADGPNVDKTLRLSGKELDQANELMTILIDGNDNSGSDDTIQIDLTTFSTADLSGWTFVDWNSINLGDRIIINGDASNETIIGSSQDDEINAGAGNNSVEGGDGNDTITSGHPNIDTINAGNGNDEIIVTGVSFGSSFDGGAGIDHLNAGATNWISDISFDLAAGFIKYAGADRDSLANIENVTVGGHASVIGDASNNEIIATSPTGNNSLVGGFGNDTLLGGGGDDTLEGGLDNDLLNGGDDNDLIEGGSGADTLIGGDGNDTLLGGGSSDSIQGGAGDDLVQILGVEFIDSVDGGVGVDTFDASGYNFGSLTIDMVAGTIDNTGAEGTKTFLNFENVIGRDGGNGDIVIGSNGDNHLDGRGGNDSLLGGGGDDTLLGGIGFDTLKGGGGHDLIQGGENSDILLGGGGNDTIFGGDHHDTIEGGGGADVIDGGTGDNTLSYETDTAGVSVNLGSNAVSGGHATGDTIFGVFNQAIGGSGNDSLTGKWGQSNTLVGGAGHDTLVGKNNADNLQGGDGNDLMTGNSGDDTILGGAGADTMDGGSDNDSLIGDAGADSIHGGGGNDHIDGGTFYDHLFGQAGDDTILGGDGNDVIGGGSGADSMDGGAGDDTVSYAADTLNVFVDLNANLVAGGNATGDTIIGFEHVVTGSGNDILVGSNDGNKLTGGDGNDSLTGNDGNDYLRGDSGNDTLLGGGHHDTLLGGKGADSLDGGTGEDSLNGGDGTDLLFGRGQNDTLVGGGGNDTLHGNAGDDRLIGSGGNDVLEGGNNNDLLKAGYGNDTLDGGSGNDTLTGGSKADIFIFNDGFGQDVITDFSKVNGEDIDLSGVANIVDYADLIANHLVDSGGDAMIVDGANTILLQGVAYNDVLNGLNGYTADDFIF